MSPDKSAREWIFAITAGVFIYISLAVMVPTVKLAFMKDELTQKRNKLRIFLMLVALFFGWSIMLMLGLFENDMHKRLASGC